MSDEITRALDYIEKRYPNLEEELAQLIQIPSVTMDKEACAQAAGWLMRKLERMGMDNIQLFETSSNPVLFAEKQTRDEHKPTVLIYGHYDVQKPDPLDEWDSEPYQLERQGEYLFGRGTSDMKGQLLAMLLAVEALLQDDLLPVNIKVLLEGNEEAPPQVLETFVPENQALLSADISLNCDAGMLGSDKPTISYGLRGGSLNIIRVTGPVRDLHDGAFGGVIENPIHVLCAMIAGLHDEHHRITLPNFYESVRVMSDEERTLLASLPVDGQMIAENAGVSQLWGDEDFTPIERIGARPSLSVRLFDAGELKGAIPRTASARLVIRLVPDQDPLEVHQQLKAYVQAHTPETVASEVEYVVGYPPYLVDRDLPAMRSLHAALADTWGSQPFFWRVGGGIPVVELLRQSLGIESLLTGFSLPDDHIHGPNERLHWPTVKLGVSALVRFFFEFAAR